MPFQAPISTHQRPVRALALPVDLRLSVDLLAIILLVLSILLVLVQ